MPRRLAAIALAAVLLGGPAGAAEPPERLVPPAERVGLDLTLYQDDAALVRDRRSVSLDKGATLLVWDGVAREARPASALLTGANLAVKAQGFELEGATGDRLLAESVGHEVGLVWRDGEREQRGRVLAAGTPPLFDVDGKVVAGQPARIVYDGLPAGFKARPSFHAVVTSETAGRCDLELTYLTGGLGPIGRRRRERRSPPWQTSSMSRLAPITCSPCPSR